MTESTLTKHRTECEQALVAIAFMDPVAAIDRVLSIVSTSDFYDRDLATVYDVLRDLHSAGFRLELEACAVELQKRGVVDRLGRHELRRILDLGHSVGNAEFYAREVARLADHRRVVAAAERILRSQHDTKADPADLLERFEAGSRITRQSDESATIGECVDEMLAQHREAKQSGSLGMRTGFPSIDKATSGIHRQQLWLIGARSNTGKTALTLSLANAMASGRADGKRRGVVMFSLEMTKVELAERICADELGINYGRFNHSSLTDEQFQQIESNRDQFTQWPFVVLDKAAQTVDEIKAKAKLYAPATGLDLIVVDTLQRVKPRQLKQDRRLQLQQIANDLKDVAKSLNCAVILCAQLNAGAEGIEPDLTHLSEGKQVIEPVDTCLLMHRPDREAESMLIKVEKLRRGARKSFYITFNGKFQRFSDPEHAQEWSA